MAGRAARYPRAPAVSLSIAVLVPWIAASAGAEPPPLPDAPPHEVSAEPRADPADGMMPRAGAPAVPRNSTDGMMPRDADPATSSLPSEGIAPLDMPSMTTTDPFLEGLPADGASPLGEGPTIRGEASTNIPDSAALPLGRGPETPVPEPLDPRLTRMFRLDFLIGPTWRIERADAIANLNVAFGRMQGLSGTFHTSFIFARDRQTVRVADIPIGVGGVLRGKLRRRDVYGSVGLTAGIMVHRANTNDQLLHRVDPDLRLPLRAAWTISDVGVSLALVPGYSVRERSYERRGVEVWKRHSVRIALLFGLHWDIVAGRAQRHAPRRHGEH